jgi:anti-sigma regulatory factor (Ser/Thr protein kinase)
VSGLVHQASMYERDEDYLATALPFLQSGIESGDAVLAIGLDDHISVLRRELGADHGVVEYGDAATWYVQPARTIAAYASYVAEHTGSQIRVVAEPGWRGRSEHEIREWTRYESIVNSAFASTDAKVLCLYDKRETSPAILDGARQTHPEIRDRDSAHVNLAYRSPRAVNLACDQAPLSPPPAAATALRIGDTDLSPLRLFVSEHARRLGMSRSYLNDLHVAITELATNAIRHGAPPIDFRLWAEFGDLVCEITDAGVWEPADVPGFTPPDPLRSGFGLWAVRMLCAVVQLRTGATGTTVRLHVPLR